MSDNSLTQCAIENCRCPSCVSRGLKISDVPNKPIVSSSTEFLGTDSFGYTAESIAAFVANNKPNDVITEIIANQNQVSNVDVYVCTGAFTIELIAASAASRELKIISILGTVTVNANGSDVINGSASTTVLTGETMVITPITAGWNGIKATQF